MTLHAAKGLEFPVVYLVAVEQGKLPHERSREDPDQLEEERRLLFVGLTRAQEMVTLSYAKYRDFRGQLSPTVPSQFLMELPRNEMTVVTAESGASAYPSDWDEFDDVTDFSPELDEVFVAARAPTSMAETEAADTLMSSLTTAASLAGADDAAPPEPTQRPDPNAFVQGMRVRHPDYGLGKVVALSGAGSNRTATVNFVTAGEKKFVVARSVLRPLK